MRAACLALLAVHLAVTPLAVQADPQAKAKPEHSVKHMVVRLTKPEKFANAILPKEYWVSDNGFTRVEEITPADALHQQLILIRVPDFWQIDLKTKEAQEITGVKKDANFSIFGKGPRLGPATDAKGKQNSDKVQTLNFGHEVDFFRSNGAKKTTRKDADGTSVIDYELPLGELNLSLETKVDSDTPRSVALKYVGKEMKLKYDSYEILPFKKSTFDVPTGLKVTKMTETELNFKTNNLKKELAEQYQKFRKKRIEMNAKLKDDTEETRKGIENTPDALDRLQPTSKVKSKP